MNVRYKQSGKIVRTFPNTPGKEAMRNYHLISDQTANGERNETYVCTTKVTVAYTREIKFSLAMSYTNHLRHEQLFQQKSDVCERVR